MKQYDKFISEEIVKFKEMSLVQSCRGTPCL